MQQHIYRSLLSQARRISRRAQEAEDLLQTVLLAALEAGRSDLTQAQNRRWVSGALRNRAAFEARTALRRRAREATFQRAPAAEADTPSFPQDFITTLPPALRTTALLALTGHTRPEIRHLLKISDAALRQRIVQIRRRWDAAEGDAIPDFPGLSGHLPFGQIRRALASAFTDPQAYLGSHDPDGHLFVISPAHKTPQRGNP